jgi:hypothetical protein
MTLNQKKIIKLIDGTQPYKNNTYIGSLLDDSYFDELLHHNYILYNDGLDALDYIPCGSCINYVSSYSELISVHYSTTHREYGVCDIDLDDL